MAPPQYRRPGTLWYVGDGLIWDDLPASYRRDRARPLECSCRLYVYNPQRRRARVTARFYHVDRAPTAIALSVAAGAIESVELAGLPEIPHKQSYWIVVESNVPVLPQAVHEDYTGWDPVPDALVAVAPYPGPLADETSWAFPDCYQSDPHQRWYEYETLSILNPGRKPARARVRYLHRYHDLGGEEEIELPGERVAQIDVWKRIPRLLGSKNGPPVRVVSDYAMRIDSDSPVIPQVTRRARWVGQSAVVGARGVTGVPLRARHPEVWYYPGGAVVDRGILPRAAESDHPLYQCDNTWNLLFISNLDERRRARAKVMFHDRRGDTSAAGPLSMPPLKSTLECLHAKPYLGEHTHIDAPFAMTVTADRPVVPEVTCAEFEMWSQVCPGAMSAVNFYPGPLRQERIWWLGIGMAGGADDVQTKWTQSYHLFNPGGRKASVDLTFLGLKRRRRPLVRSVELPPRAVARIESPDIRGLPFHQPFAVRAEGERPFCAQVFTRASTRGLPHTRAMYSSMGIPMALER